MVEEESDQSLPGSLVILARRDRVVFIHNLACYRYLLNILV